MTRLPEGLRRQLERDAARNVRSMNAEIIHRLEQSYRRQDQEKQTAKLIEQTVQHMASEMIAQLQELRSAITQNWTPRERVTSALASRIAEGQSGKDES
jgi:hypothetical protein